MSIVVIILWRQRSVNFFSVLCVSKVSIITLNGIDLLLPTSICIGFFVVIADVMFEAFSIGRLCTNGWLYA